MRIWVIAKHRIVCGGCDTQKGWGIRQQSSFFYFSYLERLANEYFELLKNSTLKQDGIST